ncbi:MAG: GNAT family N-acetyltransferase [Alphaproteobacteria bacterium]|nr:GNAT family N-acetyltransferase [Alphaproteobacteria bacterium]
MPDGREPATVKVLGSLGEVPAAQWDACAGAGDPFLSHAFLSALEESGSVSARSGWLPRHLVVEDGAGTVIAAAPMYLKSHSYGEYVFDWSWADAYERAGGRYYPKLQSAVPFTPVTGRRLLVRPGADAGTEAELEDVLAAAMVTLGERLGVSSVHVNFPTEAEWRRLGDHGFLLRTGQQYHWRNRGYERFDDFLGSLSSRKRKAIRRERRAVADQGIVLSTLTGDAVAERHWDAFYGFYRDTSDRKWGSAYLTRAFFSLIGETMAGNVVLVLAEAGGRYVGGALNLMGGDTLYGRYWGCAEAYRFLHFEACYYRAIDFAIARGLKWVEAGAQGPHKIQRGYLPRRTYSAHWIADAEFRRVIERYLAEERAAVEVEMEILGQRSPFRGTADG